MAAMLHDYKESAALASRALLLWYSLTFDGCVFFELGFTHAGFRLLAGALTGQLGAHESLLTF